MNIAHFKPRFHPPSKSDDEGSTSAEFYCDEGLVKLFVYPGGQHGQAFTELQMWLNPFVFSVKLDRAYHHRWHNRLTAQFAFECGKLAEAARQ